jgi:hypothetical protein
MLVSGDEFWSVNIVCYGWFYNRVFQYFYHPGTIKDIFKIIGTAAYGKVKKKMFTCDPWFETRSRICSRLVKQIGFGWINFQVIIILAKYILAGTRTEISATLCGAHLSSCTVATAPCEQLFSRAIFQETPGFRPACAPVGLKNWKIEQD